MDPLEAQFRTAVTIGDADQIAELGAQVDAQQAENLERLTRPEALLNAAVWYAKQGWHVFPLRTGDKRPATMHGLHDASSDVDQIREWWLHNPDANIGVRTGITFDVIDIDEQTGFDSLRAAEGMTLPTTVGVVQTPRRPGCHHYIAATGRGNKAGLLPGVDYRGVGGYVVAPPSRTPLGMYVWTTPVDLAALVAA